MLAFPPHFELFRSLHSSLGTCFHFFFVGDVLAHLLSAVLAPFLVDAVLALLHPVQPFALLQVKSISSFTIALTFRKQPHH